MEWRERLRQSTFLAQALVFVVSIAWGVVSITWFKSVISLDLVVNQLLEGMVLGTGLALTYPGVFPGQKLVPIVLLSMVMKAWYPLIALSTDLERVEVDGRTALKLSPTQRAGAAAANWMAGAVLIQGIFELWFRMKVGLPIKPFLTPEDYGTYVVSKGQDDVQQKLYDERPPNQRRYVHSKLYAIAAFVSLFMESFTSVFPALGWVDVGTGAAITLVLVLIWPAVGFYENRGKKRVRYGRGYALVAVGAITGASVVPLSITEIAKSVPDTAVLGVYVAYLCIMLLLILIMWKLSNVAMDQWRSVNLLFPYQAADDLFGSFLFLSVASFDVVSILMMVALTIRLVIRDTGTGERWWNALWTRCFGSSADKWLTELETEQARDEYILHRECLFLRKYWLYATQDMLSEHLADVLVPVMLLSNFYLPGVCLFSCHLVQEREIWLLVLQFAVLLVIKVGTNVVVERITFKSMREYEAKVSQYEARYGKLEPGSPLEMWTDYERADRSMPLVEQCQQVQAEHLHKNLGWIIVSLMYVMFLVLTTGGKIVD